MTNEMKLFLTELAELLEKHKVNLVAQHHYTEVHIGTADKDYGFGLLEGDTITPKTIKELLK